MSNEKILGFSLLHVMALAAALSAILMLDARFSKHHRDTGAIEATVLATESVLNAAFAYHQEGGSWPRESSGNRCAIPFERLNFSAAPTNGWGEDISVQSSCRRTDPVYVLEQRVPVKWASHLGERLDGTIHSASGDLAVLRVTMDRSGGAPDLVQFGRISAAGINPLRFTYAPCAEGSPHHFSSLMSAFAFEYYGSTHLINGFNNVFNGIRIVEDASASGSVAVRYNMYRYRNINGSGDITENSAVDDLNTGLTIVDQFIQFLSQDESDGNSNAVHACGNNCNGPERHQAIKAAFFFWCE